MSALSLESPFPIFTDIDGNPLEDGYIYIGEAGLNPETNPIQAYWDAALTAPAAQPVRTLGGYPSRSGSAARIYVNADDCSILVKNKNGSLIFSALNQTERLSAGLVTFIQAGTGAVATTGQAKMREVVSAFDYLSDANKLLAATAPTTLAATDALAAVQKAIDYVVANGGGTVLVNKGVYMGAQFENLNLYLGNTAVVVVEDHGRADHIDYYSNSSDVEYMFMAARPAGTGSNPVVRIHNFARDGKRIPILIFSTGQSPEAGSDTELGWVIQGSNDGNIQTNVPAHDLVIAGGQGGSYTVGTAAVDAASATVLGVGTAWTSDFIGAIFTVDGQANAAGIVKSVESTTSLTLQNIWSTYGGITAAAGAYHLQGGRWYGTLTSDYRARLVLGQNYTWLFNSGNSAGAADYDPLAVGNGNGNYAANISYVFNGNRLKGGGINPSTLLKLDNASGASGTIGFILTGGGYAGTPTRAIYLDKATNTLYFTNAVDGVGGMSLGSDGALAVTGGIANKSPTIGIGYGSGAGGSVTQITSRTTAVIINKTCGSIQTTADAIAAESQATFQVLNSTVAIGDVVVVSQRSGGNGGNTDVEVVVTAAGYFNLKISNNNAAGGADETGAIIINFAVIKAVTA